MCYDAETQTQKHIKYAKHIGESQAEIDFLESKLKKLQDWKVLYHTTGFQGNKLLVIVKENGVLEPKLMPWQGTPLANGNIANTLNAKSEEVFEKNSHLVSIHKRRCLVVLDAFFEHHHRSSKKFPFYIQKTNKETIVMAGIYGEIGNSGTEVNPVSILTTDANELLSKIHNGGKSPRMPVILHKSDYAKWLKPDLSIEEIKAFFKSYESEKLKAHTVSRIRGAELITNYKGISKEHIYRELPNGVASIIPEPKQGYLF